MDDAMILPCGHSFGSGGMQHVSRMAYLSLPEGIATAAGLIAMMTDHYNILEGSDSEHESNDVARTSRRPQKRARGKYRLMSKGPDGPCPDLLQLQSASSSYACMSLLKRKRSGGLRIWRLLILSSIKFEDVQYAGGKMLHRLRRLLQAQVAGQAARNMRPPMCREILEAFDEGRHAICKTQPGCCYSGLIFA
ncbi:uncharacterized protein A4U43_C09F3930 [Asparagus officinalis]|uniref:Uncharacterized protein n=1 Tax=Asparagus officinalis TaxID=4686 RepID=A0A5P1E554_ASPOF|nr:uncharacterized protein A4U43_C09F3930 [Asparagus officinalis]